MIIHSDRSPTARAIWHGEPVIGEQIAPGPVAEIYSSAMVACDFRLQEETGDGIRA